MAEEARQSKKNLLERKVSICMDLRLAASNCDIVGLEDATQANKKSGFYW